MELIEGSKYCKFRIGTVDQWSNSKLLKAWECQEIHYECKGY